MATKMLSRLSSPKPTPQPLSPPLSLSSAVSAHSLVPSSPHLASSFPLLSALSQLTPPPPGTTPSIDCSVLKLRNGCDYKPFEVCLQEPDIDPSRDEPTRDEIIDSYIKTLAEIVGSEDEARMMVYELCIIPGYYLFGTLLSQELYDRVEAALPGLAMIDPAGPFVNVINGKLTKQGIPGWEEEEEELDRCCALWPWQ